MRRILFSVILLFITCIGYAQNVKEWFDSNVKIRQSMETADQREEATQLQVTFVNKDSISYLINMGVSVRLNGRASQTFISKLNVEYHRNTLIRKQQNNFQIGYGYNWKFADLNTANLHLAGDLKYVRNKIDPTHSFAGNLLFTWIDTKSAVNWNAPKYINDGKESYFLSLFLGGQFQEIFAADKRDLKGFILRPLYTANINFCFNKAEIPFKPLIKLSATYTGRYDLVNTTTVGKEGYTQWLKAGIDWCIIDNPVKISLGLSANYGSDPLRGIKEQKYVLLSLNLLK